MAARASRGVHVAVVGPGAIGTSLAALLARAGERVTLVARPAAARALDGQPLRVDGSLGAFEARVPVNDRIPDDAGLVVLAVKTQDLEPALASLDLPSEATVVATQNGLRADAIVARAVGERRTVACVTVFDAIALELGRATIGRVGALMLGAGGPATERARIGAAAAALSKAAPAPVTANVAGARWLKLIVNLNNALPAATGLSIQEVYADARLARLSFRMMREGVAVARAERVRLAALPWATPLLVHILTALPEPVGARALASKTRRVLGRAPALGSTLQSVKRGRATEIDYLNGEIVARGRALGVATPVNARLVEAVREVEKGRGFFSPQELLH